MKIADSDLELPQSSDMSIGFGFEILPSNVKGSWIKPISTEIHYYHTLSSIDQVAAYQT